MTRTSCLVLIIAIVGTLAAGCGDEGQQAESGRVTQKREDPAPLYRGGSVLTDDGIAAALPTYVVDPEGPVDFEGGFHLDFNRTLFLRNETGAERTVELPQTGDGHELLRLLAFWRRDATALVLVTVCTTPVLVVETSECADAITGQTTLFRIDETNDATVVFNVDTGDRALAAVAEPTESEDGSLPALTTSSTGEGFIYELSTMDASSGALTDPRPVDERLSGRQSLCITSSGALIGAGTKVGPGGGDDLVMSVQDANGEVSSTSFPHDQGWYQDLKCGSTTGTVVTSFGARYTVGESAGGGKLTSPPADLDDMKSTRVSIVAGRSNDEFWVVGESNSETLVSGPDGLWTDGNPFLLDERQVGLAVSLDGARLLPWGTPSKEDGLFYTMSAS